MIAFGTDGRQSITQSIDEIFSQARSQRRMRRCAGLLFSALAWCMPIILFIFAASAYKHTLPSSVAHNEFVQTVFATVEAQNMISPPSDAQGLGTSFAC